MVAVHWLPIGQFLEREYGLPLLYKMRGNLPAPQNALVIGLDNDSVKSMNSHFNFGAKPWPLLDDCLPEHAKEDLKTAVNINHIPRALHGCLVDVLTARGAKVIVFDINFNLSRPGDANFAAAVGRAGNVLLFERSSGSSQGFMIQRQRPTELILKAAKGTVAFQVDSARGEITTGYLTRYAGFDDLRAMPDRAWMEHTGGDLAVAPNLIQPFWMYGPPRSIDTVQIGAVFNPDTPDVLPQDLAARTVFIGSSDPLDAGIDDHFPVPTSGRGAELIGGVELAATAFLNRLHGTMLNWPVPLVQTLLVFNMAFVGGMLVLCLTGWRLIFGIGALGVAYLMAAFLVFSKALIWLPIAVPVFLTTLLLCLAAISVRYLFARALVRRLVPAPIASKLMDNTVADRRAAINENATIMFTDLVGSTALAESMDQLAYAEIANLYYDTATELVEAEGGMVVEFQGDGIVAMFSESVTGKDHASRACAAAIALSGNLEARNAAVPEAPALKIRVGLNSGLAATGDIGARRRFTYKALGDVVNVAARLEQYGKIIQKTGENVILLSAVTRDYASSFAGETEFVGRMTLTGRVEEIEVFKIKM